MTIAAASIFVPPVHLAQILRGGVEVIDALADEWRALCESGPYDEPFYRPEWIAAYFKAFAPFGQLIIATVRRAGRLVAVLPLIKETGMLGGIPTRKLRSAGNTHTCRCELVHDENAADEAIPTLWAALLRERGWDVLVLENVPAGGALERLANYASSAGYSTHRIAVLTPPYLDLSGPAAGFDHVLGRLDAKFRANLRRRMRKLAARGPLTVVETCQVDRSLQRFYDLERAGWKGAQKSAIDCDEATRAFYDAVAEAATRYGYFSLRTLQSAGAPAAMFYGLTHKNRFFLVKTAYDEELREFSPGQLLMHEVLRDLTSRNCCEFDFLGGALSWKQDWSPSLRQLNNIHIYRGAAGRAIHTLRFRIRPTFVRAVRRARGT